MGYDDNFNEKISVLCRYALKPQRQEEKIHDLVFRRDQSVKQWMIAWQEALVEYKENRMPDSTQRDEIDRLILASGVCDVSFSDDSYYFIQGGENIDETLARALIELLVNLFGGFTYSQMVKGSIFARNGVLRFTIPVKKERYASLRKSFISTHSSVFWKQTIMGDIQEYAMNLATQRAQLTVRVKASSIDVDFQESEINVKSMPLSLLFPMEVESFSDLSELLSLALDERGVREVDHDQALVGLYLGLIELYESKLSHSGLPARTQQNVRAIARNSIKNFVFGRRGYSSSSDAIASLMSYLSSRGTIADTITLKGRVISSFDGSENELVLPADPELFESLFGNIEGAYAAMKAMKTTISPGGQGPELMERQLRAQQDAILKLASFLKEQAESNGEIIIYPFKESKWGLRNGIKEEYGDYDYLPHQAGDELATMPHSKSYFVLNKDDLGAFDDDFYLLLGGLLLDDQTFVLKTRTMAEDEMICAFNLAAGVMNPRNLPWWDRTRDPDPKEDRFEWFAPINLQWIDNAEIHELVMTLATFSELVFSVRVDSTTTEDWLEACRKINAIGFSSAGRD